MQRNTRIYLAAHGHDLNESKSTKTTFVIDLAK